MTWARRASTSIDLPFLTPKILRLPQLRSATLHSPSSENFGDRRFPRITACSIHSPSLLSPRDERHNKLLLLLLGCAQAHQYELTACFFDKITEHPAVGHSLSGTTQTPGSVRLVAGGDCSLLISLCLRPGVTLSTTRRRLGLLTIVSVPNAHHTRPFAPVCAYQLNRSAGRDHHVPRPASTSSYETFINCAHAYSRYSRVPVAERTIRRTPNLKNPAPAPLSFTVSLPLSWGYPYC